jgi:hypothetical protein
MKVGVLFKDNNGQLAGTVKGLIEGLGGPEFALLANQSDLERLASSQEEVLCLVDESTIQEIDVEKVGGRVKFLFLAPTTPSEMANRAYQSLDANIFLAEDLLGATAVGPKLFALALRNAFDSSLLAGGGTGGAGNALFGAAAKSVQFEISSTGQKNEVLRGMEEAILEYYESIPPAMADFYATKVATVADELILNAVYDANPRLKRASRGSEEALLEGERVTVHLGLAPQMISLSVRDGFGTFQKESFFKHAARLNVSEQVSDRTSGGLGLRLSLDASTQLIVNVKQGEFTEMISLFIVANSMKAFRQQVKSLLCLFR